METMSIQDKRPPFVQFEMRAVRDAEASLREGRPMFRDVAHVVITQHGGRDVHEDVAEGWLDKKHREAASGAYPPDWVKAYRHMYEEWKKGNAMPLNGTPVRIWPGASPAEAAACIAANVLTVEDLAEVSDGNLVSLGLGGRTMRDKARSYLEAAKGNGKLVEELAAMRAEIATMRSTLESEREKRTELEAALSEKRGPGRPRKEDAA